MATARPGRQLMDIKRAATLVRIRTVEQDIALAAWGKAQHERTTAEQVRDDWADKLADWTRQVGMGWVRSGRQVREQLLHLANARTILERHSEHVEAKKVVETQLHGEWQERKQRQEGVIRLHERVETEMKTAELQREQMLIDDITSTRHQRRGEAS